MSVAALTRRPVQEHQFKTHDGVDLFYRHWPATDGPRRGVIVLFHRGHEHSGRMAHLVDELDLPGFDFFAWDARGHGRSPGARGYSPSFGTSVRDIQTFMAHLGADHQVRPEDTYVVAQSVGAVLVSTWLHDYAPQVRGVTLASPAFKVKLYVPFARPGLALMHKLRGLFFVNSYVKPKFLTHDPARIESYKNDPLISRPIAVNILLGLYEAADRIVADAQAISVPVQLLVSGSDFVVHRGPQDRFYERLSSPIKERVHLPGFFHDTLGERDRAPALARIRSFIQARFAEPLRELSRRDAHRHGPTFEESEILAWPPERNSLADLRWRVVRGGLRVGGTLSEGIALGLQTGFDSGSTLDYIYRDEARGKGPLGRMVDRNYLDAIGWRGIRIRGQHLQELLRDAAQRLRGQGTPVRVLDVAAGHGRYVLEALGQGEQRAERIVLRDFSDLNVTQGQALIDRLGASDIAHFEQGDAFDPVQLAQVDPAPTLAVVSGLYELFPDNDAVLRSLQGIAATVPVGGYLAYTGQPWHPQLEFIARALTSHRGGAAWVMRRRTQQEMDELVRLAGFEKVAQRIDAFGIFTVSLARRTA